MTPEQSQIMPPDGDKEYWKGLYMQERDCRIKWQQVVQATAAEPDTLDVQTESHHAAILITHEEAGRVLSKKEFDLCVRIAKRAYQDGYFHPNHAAENALVAQVPSAGSVPQDSSSDLSDGEIDRISCGVSGTFGTRSWKIGFARAVIAADRATATVSVAEPVAYVNQADLDLLANYGTSGACVLYNRTVGNATIPLYASQPAADNAPQEPRVPLSKEYIKVIYRALYGCSPDEENYAFAYALLAASIGGDRK